MRTHIPPFLPAGGPLTPLGDPEMGDRLCQFPPMLRCTLRYIGNQLTNGHRLASQTHCNYDEPRATFVYSHRTFLSLSVNKNAPTKLIALAFWVSLMLQWNEAQEAFVFFAPSFFFSTILCNLFALFGKGLCMGNRRQAILLSYVQLL